MNVSFFAKKVLVALFMPPTLPILLVIVGLVLLHWRRRLGLALAWSGALLSVLLTQPITVSWMVGALETAPVVAPAQLREAQAIVILAGGRRAYAPEFRGGQTVNRLTLERIRYGAKLARETDLPILVSGGAPTRGTPEAELMRRALIDDYGITPKWVETRSLDTAGNAQLSAPILHAHGIQRIVLVTHAAHMTRAAAEFRHAGFEVIPAPTAFLASPTDHEEIELSTFFPNANAAYAGWYGSHEWVGILIQRLQGRG
ncbi:MAG: YdcF family protein [Betaproteobacteria bacterium]|nr:YdcF family protein [Betaproteobacteria bacterium]